MEVLTSYSSYPALTRRLQGLAELPARRTPESPRPPRRRYRRISPDEQASLVAAYRAGATVRELAAKHGRDREAVSGALKRAGIEFHYRVLSSAQISEAADRYRGGESLAKLGKRYGVTADTVAAALRRAGVQIRPRPGG